MQIKSKALIAGAIFSLIALTTMQGYLTFNTYDLRKKSFASDSRTKIGSIVRTPHVDSLSWAYRMAFIDKVPEYKNGSISKEELLLDLEQYAASKNDSFLVYFNEGAKHFDLDSRVLFKKEVSSIQFVYKNGEIEDLVTDDKPIFLLGTNFPTNEGMFINAWNWTFDEGFANANTIIASTFEVCENALTGQMASATHTTEAICSTSNPDVWYSFTPSETTEYTFRADLVNGAMPLYIGIYTGTPGFLNQIAESPTSPTLQCSDIVLADLTAGTTYYLSVTSPDSSQAIYFELCAYKSPAPPTNDDCSNPTPLTIGQSFEDNYIVATTTSASVNSDNSNFPSCGTLPDFGIYGRDVWFTVTVPASGSFTIETRAEPGETNLNNTAVETFTGSCESDSETGTNSFIPFYYNLPPPNTGTVYCSNQFVIGGNPYAGMLFTDKTPGEIVYVRVYGWAYQFGKFRISAYDDSALSVETFDSTGFSYYPNPTNNVLNIKYKQNINKVTINSLLGKAVLTKEVNAKSAALDLSSLNTGIYIVTVNSGNTTTNFKVVKK